MRTSPALLFVILLTTSAAAQAQSRDSQAVTVGPWAIATNYKSDKFESCTMISLRRRAWNSFYARSERAAGAPGLAKVEAQQRQSLFCPPRCRFALSGCSCLG